MTKNSSYIIQFKGLAIGTHAYQYEIQDEFFNLFENSEIEKGSLKLDFVLHKKSNFMEFEFDLSGTINIACDRCLDLYDQEIDYNGKIVVKFGDSNEELSDEMIVLHKDEYQIDLKDYIFELISLNVPLKKVHPNDKEGNSTCNQEMIDKIEKYSSKEESTKIDSRWDKLNDLIK